MVKRKEIYLWYKCMAGYGKHLYGHDDVKYNMDMDQKPVTL